MTDDPTPTDEGTDTNRRDVLAEAAADDGHGNFFAQQRRGFVASAAAAIAGVFGLSQRAAAADDPHAAAARYDTEEAARRALVRGTRELRATLHERGVLDTPAASELTTVPFRSIPDYLDAEEGFVSYGTVHEGTATAGISVARQLDDAELKVVLYPDTGETFAVVTEDGAEQGTVVRPGDDGVSTQEHPGCENCTLSFLCDRWYDGGQYWCIPKTIYNCDDCYVCHDDDFSCDTSCSDHC